MPDPGSESRTGSFDPASSNHVDPGFRCAPIFHRFFALALNLNLALNLVIFRPASSGDYD